MPVYRSALYAELLPDTSIVKGLVRPASNEVCYPALDPLQSHPPTVPGLVPAARNIYPLNHQLSATDQLDQVICHGADHGAGSYPALCKEGAIVLFVRRVVYIELGSGQQEADLWRGIRDRAQLTQRFFSIAANSCQPASRRW